MKTYRNTCLFGRCDNGRRQIIRNALFYQSRIHLHNDRCEKFENGAVVDVQALLDAGILSKCEYGFKVLGNGNITKSITVTASAFSESAKAKIEAAGGKAEVV